MRKGIDNEKIRQFQTMTEPLSLQDAIKESNRCLLCKDAPCSTACPAGTDPGKFIRQIRFENYKGAARTIRNNNAMGRICAFVCPVEELCEKECSIKALEDPINIAGLQRFASEYGEKFGLEQFRKSNNSNSKVAIIGAGPAGFGCAAELAKQDYQVTIFEKENEAAGVPKYGIPAFRLPKEAIEYDLKNLNDLGVNILYNKHFRSKNEVTDLLKADFKAVFIGTGLTEGFTMNVFDGYKNAVTSNMFLHNAETDRKKSGLDGKTVAVIGGGSVAMDTASTAVALGAKRVYIIYRRTIHEMPAAIAEIEVAREMNVNFRTLSVIKDVVAVDNIITALKGIEVEWSIPEGSSSKVANEIDGTEFGIKVDLVIQAVGSTPNKEIQDIASGIKTRANGVIDANKDFSTNIPGVFAGGDIVNGGATVVLAVAQGKKAAESIDNYLKNGGA